MAEEDVVLGLVVAVIGIAGSLVGLLLGAHTSTWLNLLVTLVINAIGGGMNLFIGGAQ